MYSTGLPEAWLFCIGMLLNEAALMGEDGKLHVPPWCAFVNA